MFHSDIVNIMRCPVCNEALILDENEKSLLCNGARKHCFDISAKGHVNFSMGHSGGDSKEAVQSRSAFLSKDYYRPFADKICELISKYVKCGTVVDAGCGEGYYTNLVAQKCGVNAVGFDLSKFGVEHAAACAKRTGIINAAYCVAGIYSMPLQDKSADCIMNLFAPCAEEEFKRVLKDNGVLIVAGAGAEHLFGLKKAVYDTPYKNEVRNDLPASMKLVESVKVRFDMELSDKEDRMNLFTIPHTKMK